MSRDGLVSALTALAKALAGLLSRAPETRRTAPVVDVAPHLLTAASATAKETPVNDAPQTPPPAAGPASRLTPEALATILGGPPERGTLWLPHVQKVAESCALTTRERLAAFLAQTGHESAGYSILEEGLNYSAKSLMATWPKRFPPELAEACSRKPERIANIAYANRLGNGDEASGDGWRFRGRGLIQVTGKDNYRACGLALGGDFLSAPSALALPSWAALSAGWYWTTRKLNAIVDGGNYEALTRAINGGTHGHADRVARYERALAVLKDLGA